MGSRSSQVVQGRPRGLAAIGAVSFGFETGVGNLSSTRFWKVALRQSRLGPVLSFLISSTSCTPSGDFSFRPFFGLTKRSRCGPSFPGLQFLPQNGQMRSFNALLTSPSGIARVPPSRSFLISSTSCTPSGDLILAPLTDLMKRSRCWVRLCRNVNECPQNGQLKSFGAPVFLALPLSKCVVLVNGSPWLLSGVRSLIPSGVCGAPCFSKPSFKSSCSCRRWGASVFAAPTFSKCGVLINLLSWSLGDF